eukprot:SAG11_NODE_33_length_22289_cov_12.857999_23_plen_61_part_00
MNKPLMFINNDTVIEQLKNDVWEKYKEVKNGDFPRWYNKLGPVEKTAWKDKFNEIQENDD